MQTLTRSSTCAQALAQRAHMILLAFDCWDNQDIADRLGCERPTVGLWRRRWAKAFQRLTLIECCEKSLALLRAIEDLLSDLPWPGCPGKFTAEQIALLLAVACEPPEDSGRPVTYWTPAELADEVQQRGSFASISSSDPTDAAGTGKTQGFRRTPHDAHSCRSRLTFPLLATCSTTP